MEKTGTQNLLPSAGQVLGDAEQALQAQARGVSAHMVELLGYKVTE